EPQNRRNRREKPSIPQISSAGCALAATDLARNSRIVVISVSRRRPHLTGRRPSSFPSPVMAMLREWRPSGFRQAERRGGRERERKKKRKRE
ncbi:hypothetical protein Dimus_023280, partial [Dionaea muscipula]